MTLQITEDDLDFEFDDWEQSALEHLARHQETLSDSRQQLYKNTTDFPIVLGRKIISDDLDGGKTLLDEELIDKLAMFNARTQFFWKHWNTWLVEVESDRSNDYYVKPNMFHLFAPMFAQQFEGPLRYELAALIDLITTLHDGSGNWHSRLYTSSGDKKKFANMLQETIDQLDRLSDVNGISSIMLSMKIIQQHEDIIDVSQVTDVNYIPKVNEFRNAIAHADYQITFADENNDAEYVVRFNLHQDSLERPIDHVFHFFYNQMILLHYLSMGILIAVANIALNTGRQDYFMTMIESLTLNYPPTGEMSISPELREIFENQS